MDRVCAGVSGPQAEGDDAKSLHRTLLPRRSNRFGSRAPSLRRMSAGTVQVFLLRLAEGSSSYTRPIRVSGQQVSGAAIRSRLPDSIIGRMYQKGGLQPSAS